MAEQEETVRSALMKLALGEARIAVIDRAMPDGPGPAVARRVEVVVPESMTVHEAKEFLALATGLMASARDQRAEQWANLADYFSAGYARR
jgi:hypothetical protein